jgi:hypothetical protein
MTSGVHLSIECSLGGGGVGECEEKIHGETTLQKSLLHLKMFLPSLALNMALYIVLYLCNSRRRLVVDENRASQRYKAKYLSISNLDPRFKGPKTGKKLQLKIVI